MTDLASPPSRRLARAVGGSVFGTDAAGYHDARLGYPAELYDAILARRGSGGAVLEIGPGTGLATAGILARLAPARVVAVEADPVLAAALAARLGDGRLAVVAAPFVEVPLDGVGEPFDLACCAAAFHWLDAEAAFARLRTLLRPGATLALWWNVYRSTGVGDAFSEAVTPLLDDLDLAPSEGETGHYSLDVDHHRAAMTAAGFTGFAPFLFRRERTLDAGQARALYASYSYVRALPPPRREALLDSIAAIARERFGGRVLNVVLTPLYLADLPAS